LFSNDEGAYMGAQGTFGWVSNSKPDSRKPPSSCLVARLKYRARLHGATNNLLARLQKNIGVVVFSGARLGLEQLQQLFYSYYGYLLEFL